MAGGFHAPSRTDSLGQYIRNVTLNAPSGAGSQFDCFCVPGESCWTYTSSDPSRLYFSGIHPAMLYRLIGLAARKLCASYIVKDQKAFTGGRSPLSKWSTYRFEPVSGWLSPSTKAVG